MLQGQLRQEKRGWPVLFAIDANSTLKANGDRANTC